MGVATTLAFFGYATDSVASLGYLAGGFLRRPGLAAASGGGGGAGEGGQGLGGEILKWRWCQGRFLPFTNFQKGEDGYHHCHHANNKKNIP